MNEPRTLIIDLDQPIMNGAIPVSSITVNPPTVGGRRKAAGHLRSGRNDEADAKFEIAIVASCTGLPDSTIEQLEVDVFNKALVHVMGFLVPKDTTD
jgi:hypothetical protein